MPQDYDLPSERHSLLDMLENKNQSANRKTILNRIVIVGKFKNSATGGKIGEYYDVMFKSLQQQQTNLKTQNPFMEKVSGLMIAYPSLFVHLIESSNETIKAVLADLDRMQNEPDGMITEAKILSYSHEIHIRLYPFYTFKYMNLSLEHDSSEPTDSTETLVNDIVTRLLRLGKYLTENTKVQSKNEFMVSLHDSHPEFFPNQNFANFLLRNKSLESPKDYLNYYEQPLDIILESDYSS